MIKPVNPRHHIVTYMPLKLLLFLIQEKVLSLWLKLIQEYMKDEKITAPELIRRMKNQNILYDIIWVCFLVEENEKRMNMLRNIDNKWTNSNLWNQKLVLYFLKLLSCYLYGIIKLNVLSNTILLCLLHLLV